MTKFLSAVLLAALCVFPQHHRKIFTSGGGGGITAGDGIVCELGSANAFVAGTDTLNLGSFSTAYASSAGSPINWNYTIVYLPNSTHGSTDTITLTITSPSTSTSAGCQAVKHMATSSPVDSNTFNPGGASTTGANASSGNFTTTASGEFAVSIGAFSSVTPTAGASWTLIDSIPAEAQWNEYQVLGAASSSATATWTNTSDFWLINWATFLNDGSTPSLDGTCHASTDNGGSSSSTIAVTITC